MFEYLLIKNVLIFVGISGARSKDYTFESRFDNNIYKAGKYFNDVRNRSANDLDQTNEFDEMFVSIDANVRIRSVT